jgi:hypothetical protein
MVEPLSPKCVLLSRRTSGVNAHQTLQSTEIPITSYDQFAVYPPVWIFDRYPMRPLQFDSEMHNVFFEVRARTD